MSRRLAWTAAGIAALALVLAFPLREVLERTVIVPLAYVFWAAGLFYRTMPQLLWWGLVVIIVMILLLGSLAPGDRFAYRHALALPPGGGQVEELAASITKSGDGVYYKWIVANRLGKLAYNMLVQREGVKDRSVFSPLLGQDWEPSPHLREYLETGLHGSFSDYPSAGPSRLLSPTPLDVDIEEAVNFLESQLEARRD